jgi:glycosyltransferase involved in cell wall biosynthesis
MPRSPSISAIIAVYNPNPVFLEKAVSSVLEQSYPVSELIIVNDGGKGDVLDAVLPADTRIHVFAKRNEGVAATRNYAIRHCTGDYIAFLDQDDYWFRNKLEEQIALIPETGGPCMVAAPVSIVDAGGIIIEKKTTLQAAHFQVQSGDSNVLRHLAAGNFIYSSSPLISREVFTSVGGFDSSVQPHDDWDMYLRIAQAGIPVYLYHRRPLSVWRIHDSNESKKMAAMSRTKCRILRRLHGSAEDENFRKALCINYLIESIDRSHLLLYKQNRMALFRYFVAGYAFKMLKQLVLHGRSNPEILTWQSARIRKLLMKTVRRMFISCFPQASA